MPAGIFISLAVLSETDILTAYLPVVGEHRGIAPSVIGVLLSLRAAATIACRLVLTHLLRLLGRTPLLTVTCLLASLLCAGIALPVPVWALGLLLAGLGFCLGVGQPLSMTTVVQASVVREGGLPEPGGLRRPGPSRAAADHLRRQLRPQEGLLRERRRLRPSHRRRLTPRGPGTGG